MPFSEDVFKVASYQGPICEGDFEKNLDLVCGALAEAERSDVDVLCMPECFLHGYYPTRELAILHSVDLSSALFSRVLERLTLFQRTTLILGLNELVGDQVFNTAVVIEAGQLKGKYRKAYTYSPYDYYTLGTEFPVFEKRGVTFSVIICYDSVFREPALISAWNGAQILFCPMFNRVRKDDPMVDKLSRKGHLIARAFDCNCWLVSSDITWEDETQTCPGFATILDGDGEIVAVAQPFEATLLGHKIPMAVLAKRKTKRLVGNPALFNVSAPYKSHDFPRPSS